MKKCKRCQNTKPLSEFYKRKSYDCYNSNCISCDKIRSRIRQDKKYDDWLGLFIGETNFMQFYFYD